MAKVTKITAEYGISAEIQGIWHRVNSGIEIEIEGTDNVQEVKDKAWRTVKHQVENKVIEITEE